jgi:hypothetical protein
LSESRKVPPKGGTFLLWVVMPDAPSQGEVSHFRTVGDAFVTIDARPEVLTSAIPAIKVNKRFKLPLAVEAS